MTIMAAILKLFVSLIFWTKGPVDLKIGRKDFDDL